MHPASAAEIFTPRKPRCNESFICDSSYPVLQGADLTVDAVRGGRVVCLKPDGRFTTNLDPAELVQRNRMLTNRRTRAAWLKANGRAMSISSRAVGIHKTSYYRWLKKPEFLKAVADAETKQPPPTLLHPRRAEDDLLTVRDDDRRVY